MADAVNPYSIPPGVFPVVAGYIDGAVSTWPAAGWKYHDQSLHFTITVLGNPAAMCADVEKYDLTPSEGAAFVKAKRDRGEHPYLYFSLSQLGAVRAALSAIGLDPDHAYTAWIADWDGVAALPAGWLMKQYADGQMLGTGYDESVIVDYLAGLDALPPPPPVSGPGVGVEGWSGLQLKVDVDIPAFGAELGVLASGLQGLG